MNEVLLQLFKDANKFANLKFEPYRSGGFINQDCDMARISIELPIIEAKKFMVAIKQYNSPNSSIFGDNDGNK